MNFFNLPFACSRGLLSLAKFAPKQPKTLYKLVLRTALCAPTESQKHFSLRGFSSPNHISSGLGDLQKNLYTFRAARMVLRV